MTGSAECASSNDTLVDAARKLRDLDVGALPICGDDDRLAGMVTDRDIVVKLHRRGRRPHVGQGRRPRRGQAGHHRRRRLGGGGAADHARARRTSPAGHRRPRPGRDRDARPTSPGTARKGRSRNTQLEDQVDEDSSTYCCQHEPRWLGVERRRRPDGLAVNEFSAATGALFVLAAGTPGSEAGLSAPGAADAALTVGAGQQRPTSFAYFSSMGPRFGTRSETTDISAPGVDILAALAGGQRGHGLPPTMSGLDGYPTSPAPPDPRPAASPVDSGTAQDALIEHLQAAAYTALPVRLPAGSTSPPASPSTVTAANRLGLLVSRAEPHSSTAPIDRTITYGKTANSGGPP